MNSSQRDDLLTRPVGAVLIVILVIVSALAYFLPQFTHVGLEEETEDRFFTIVLTATYENRNSEGALWNFTEDDTVASLFMNNSWQTVCLANSSYRIERAEIDADGNPVAFMSFPESRLNSGENFSFEVAYRIVLKPRSVPELTEEGSGSLSDIPEDLRDLHCSSVGPWQMDDRRLQDLASELAGNETRVLTVLRKFIEWIRDHISRETLDVPRYPVETFQGRAGDCDDQANLFITLCRITGIPAYLQAGCIYVSNKHTVDSNWNGCLINELTRIAWHGWAVAYVPPWGWLPVDFTYVTLSDLRADALNAIKLSAIIAHPTVQYANFTVTDYIAACRDRRDFQVAHGFHIYGHDVMSEETAGEGAGTAALILPIVPLLILHVLPSTPAQRGSKGHRTNEISRLALTL